MGMCVTLVAIWAETRNRNNHRDDQAISQDGKYWRDSSLTLSEQLRAERAESEAARKEAKTLEIELDRLRTWTTNYVNEHPPEEGELTEDGKPLEATFEGPEGFLRSLWRLVW